jgi:hypothetical protein
MEKFLEYIELILTGVGVVIIMTVFAIFRHISPWKAAAICAIAVGIVHGVIFYTVRSAQRKVRHKAVRAIRYKLQDVVVEKMNALLLAADLKEDELTSANYAIQDIQRDLAIIEAESLLAGRFH